MNNVDDEGFDFIDGAHSGDYISQLTNEEVLFELLITQKNVDQSKLTDNLDYNAMNYYSELVSELSFRIRSYTISIDDYSNLYQILSLDDRDIYEALIELDLETSTQIMAQVYEDYRLTKIGDNFYNHFFNYYSVRHLKDLPKAYQALYKEFQNYNSEKLSDLTNQFEKCALLNMNLLTLMQKEFPIDSQIIHHFLLKKEEKKYKNIFQISAVLELLKYVEPEYLMELDKIQAILGNNIEIIPSIVNLVPKESSLFEYKNALNLIENMPDKHLSLVFSTLPSHLLDNPNFIKNAFLRRKLLSFSDLPEKYKQDNDFIVDLTFMSSNDNILTSYLSSIKEVETVHQLFHIYKDMYEFQQKYSLLMNKENIKDIRTEFYGKFPYISQVTDVLYLIKNIDNKNKNVFDSYFKQPINKLLLYPETNKEILNLALKNTSILKTDIYSFYSQLKLYQEYNSSDSISFLKILCSNQFQGSNSRASNPECYNETFSKAHEQFCHFLDNLMEQHKDDIDIKHLANLVVDYLYPESKKNIFNVPAIQEKDMNYLLLEIPFDILEYILDNNKLPQGFINYIGDRNFSALIDSEKFLSDLKILNFEKDIEDNAAKSNIPVKKVKF